LNCVNESRLLASDRFSSNFWNQIEMFSTMTELNKFLVFSKPNWVDFLGRPRLYSAARFSDSLGIPISVLIWFLWQRDLPGGGGGGGGDHQFPLRTDFLRHRSFAGCQASSDNVRIRRLLALQPVESMNPHGSLHGSVHGPPDAALALGASLQWGHRTGRFDQCQGAGRPRLLNDEQMPGNLSQMSETGPDLEVDGVWFVGERIDLVRGLKSVSVSWCFGERAITDYLQNWVSSNMSGRPQHLRQDARWLKASIKTSQTRFHHTSRLHAPSRNTSRRYGSRMRRGSVKKNGQVRTWDEREPVPRLPAAAVWQHPNLFGAMLPKRVTGSSAWFRPKANTPAMQLHL